ncbi:MAG: FlgD immunoglobulin-like domain containing protein, partial [bacterium]|nr:FlgD immunoglobulin-like domain containing protein [bacterium]
FAEAYERNGAAVSVGQAVVYDGHPAGVSDWNGYKAQFFNGGNYGLGFVMYDPWNWDGNECATNEAYYVRTGFREYYLEEGGPSFFGCPTRDEYEIGGVPVQDFYNRNTDTYYRMEWHGTYASHYNLDPCGSGGSQGGNGDPVVLCTPDPGSILGNGDFSEGDNCWTYFAWPEERGELHLGTNTVELEIHGTGEYWSVSFSQACEIAANQYYRLFFDYESVNTLHPILVMTDANDHNQNYGLWHEFTTQRYDWFHKEVEFRATSTSSSAEFMFCVGSHNGKFRIRNARIEVIASPPPPPPSCDGDDPDSFIGNGQFYGPNCWESASPNHPYVVFNFNGQFESHVNGPYPWYDVKLSQDWVWLQAGSQCEVIWTGAVNAPSRVIVALEDGSGGHVLWEEVWLTSTEQEFTMPFWPQATNPAGKLVFYLGEVDQSVWIKDVVVRYADAPPPPPVCDGDDSESFIGNGQFYGSSCWNLADPNERGVATEYDGQFEAHVNGPYPYYDIRLSQDWVWLQDESACELVWTGAVNSPSQVIAAIEYADGSYVLWEEVTLTSTDQQFVMPFWPQATDPAGKLVFFLGDVDQSVWIKDVSVRWSSGQARALPKTSLAVSPNPAKAGGPLAVRFNLNRATSVNLEIYNVAGQLARSIDVGLLPAGGHVYDWDGRSGDGERVPSGIYFIRLRGDVESSLRRVVIVR